MEHGDEFVAKVKFKGCSPLVRSVLTIAVGEASRCGSQSALSDRENKKWSEQIEWILRLLKGRGICDPEPLPDSNLADREFLTRVSNMQSATEKNGNTL